MHRIIRSILCIFLITATVLAAETDSLSLRPVKGDQALQFKIGNGSRSLVTLDEYGGANLSYKRVLSDRKALQVGLEMRGGQSAREQTEAFPQVDTLNNSATSDDSFLDLELSLQLIHATVGERHWLYYGYGPAVSYSIEWETNESRLETNPPQIDKWDRTYINYGLGLTGLIGVEWALNDFLTLHAEYRSSLMYHITESEQIHTDEDPDMYNEDDYHSHYLDFIPDGVRFGLSVYF